MGIGIWTHSFLQRLCFLFLICCCCGNNLNETSYTKEVDDLGDLIDKKGKDIDLIGAQIDANANQLERSIEEHESDVDSATARQKIEERGKDIDAISDYMDRLIESKGDGIETEVPGTKHSVLPNGTSVEEHVLETPMDVAIRKVEQQADKVQLIGNSIFESKKRRRGYIPKVTYHHKRTFIQLDPDDEDSKIPVPVTEKKLNKLKLFYYIKRNYPKFVSTYLEKTGLNTNTGKHEKESSLKELIDREFQKIQKSEPLKPHSKILNTSSLKDLTGNKTSNTGNSSNPTEEDGEDELDEIISSVSNKATKLTENNLDEIMSNLIQRESFDTDVDLISKSQQRNNEQLFEQENIKNILNQNVGKPEASVTDVEIKKEKNFSNSLEDVKDFKSFDKNKDAVNCISNPEIGCMMHELVDLFHETYTNDGRVNLESSIKGEKVATGETRGGGDPYASIGHNSFRHGSHDGESVHANKYYDKNVDYDLDSFHGNDINRWIGHHWGHGHEISGGHIAHTPQDRGHHQHGAHHHSDPELESMIHSMPDLHAVNFGDNIHNAVPHRFQNILQVENEHKQQEKEAKEHAEMLKGALEEKGKQGKNNYHNGHLSDGNGFNKHQSGHLFGMYGYGFNMGRLTREKDRKDDKDTSLGEREKEQKEEHDGYHHAGSKGSTEFIGDESDFKKGKNHERMRNHRNHRMKYFEHMEGEEGEGGNPSSLGSQTEHHDREEYHHRENHHDHGLGAGSMGSSSSSDISHDGHHHQNHHMQENFHGTGAGSMGTGINHIHHNHNHHQNHHMQQNFHGAGAGSMGAGTNHHHSHDHHHQKNKGQDHDKLTNHLKSKRCCNKAIREKRRLNCRPCTHQGNRRDDDGTDPDHDDKDINTGDEHDDEMYHHDHEERNDKGGEPEELYPDDDQHSHEHHHGEPQFGDSHEKEEHHPGELHYGAGQEDSHKDDEKEEQGHHHYIHNERNEHLHHHEFPIVHINHDKNVHQDPGESIYNQHEMVMDQNTHAHLHENPHQEVESDDRIIPPNVAHEGPITLAPAFQGEHFHGPGIRDQPDVHYEDEMDLGRYRYKRALKAGQNILNSRFKLLNVRASKRQDPYATIGHYPEMKMDIHELEHDEIQSEHEGNFGCHTGGGYGWCPDGIGFGGHHHHHHHHHDDHDHHHEDDDGGDDDDYDDEDNYHHHRENEDHSEHGKKHKDKKDDDDDEHKSRKRRVYYGQHVDAMIHRNDELPRRVYHDRKNGTENDKNEEKTYIKELESYRMSGDEGTDDFEEHDQHIQQPDPEPKFFNGHVYVAIPHIDEQLEHEESHYDSHHRFHSKQHDDRHKDATSKLNKHNHTKPEPEHQDMQDHDINRLVHVHDYDAEKRDRMAKHTNLNIIKEMIKPSCFYCPCKCFEGVFVDPEIYDSSHDSHVDYDRFNHNFNEDGERFKGNFGIIQNPALPHSSQHALPLHSSQNGVNVDTMLPVKPSPIHMDDKQHIHDNSFHIHPEIPHQKEQSRPIHYIPPRHSEIVQQHFIKATQKKHFLKIPSTRKKLFRPRNHYVPSETHCNCYRKRHGIRNMNPSIESPVKKDDYYHHHTHMVPNHPYVGENGSEDYYDHDNHIHEPNSEPMTFNGHVHPAVPHLSEQAEHTDMHHHHHGDSDWYHEDTDHTVLHHHEDGHHGNHHDSHHEDDQHDNHHYDNDHHDAEHEHIDHHHHDKQHPEHLHPQDKDENRIVHVNDHGWLHKRNKQYNKQKVSQRVSIQRYYDNSRSDKIQSDSSYGENSIPYRFNWNIHPALPHIEQLQGHVIPNNIEQNVPINPKHPKLQTSSKNKRSIYNLLNRKGSRKTKQKITKKKNYRDKENKLSMISNKSHIDCEEDCEEDADDEDDDDEDEDEEIEEDHTYGFEGEDGSDDFLNHHIHIQEPDPNLHGFNGHVHPAIPHLFHQVEHEPYNPHIHMRSYNYRIRKQRKDRNDHSHHGEPRPEHQHPSDQDENRHVHIRPHHLHNYVIDHHELEYQDEDNAEDDGDGDDDDEDDNDENKRRYIINKNNVTINGNLKDDITNPILIQRLKREEDENDGGFHHHYHRSYVNDYDDDGDNDEGDHHHTTGKDVAQLSFLTEKYGQDMSHDIDMGTHEVERVGDAIESSINHGIESVQHVGYEIEVPDYDHHGNFYPNVHEEDVQEDVERRFPHLHNRDLISMVLSEHGRKDEPLGRPVHRHVDIDDDEENEDEDEDEEDEEEFHHK